MTTTAISISQTSKDWDGSLSNLKESSLTQQVDRKATTITRPIKKPFLRRIDELQEEIDKLQEECQDSLQDSATVKWETESLILSFREKTLDIKELIPHHLEIQQKDTTLSEICEKRVSRWVDNHSVPSIRDMAIQMDLEKTSSGQCPAKYWKACQDNYCRQHLEEKQNQQWFPGTKAMELY